MPAIKKRFFDAPRPEDPDALLKDVLATATATEDPGENYFAIRRCIKSNHTLRAIEGEDAQSIDIGCGHASTVLRVMSISEETAHLLAHIMIASDPRIIVRYDPRTTAGSDKAALEVFRLSKNTNSSDPAFGIGEWAGIQTIMGPKMYQLCRTLVPATQSVALEKPDLLLQTHYKTYYADFRWRMYGKQLVLFIRNTNLPTAVWMYITEYV